MRIIEPQDLHKTAHRKRSLPKPRVFLVVALSIITVAVAIVFGSSFFDRQQAASSAETGEQLSQPNTQAAVTQVPIKTRNLRVFTSEEFRDLYNTFAYPNTTEITDPISITGNEAADERIRSLAEQRGYRKHSVPVAEVIKVDGFSLQQKAVQPWLDMKNAAAKDGLMLGITAAFRSPAEQRLIFMQQLDNTGVTVEQVAEGSADNAVDQALARASIPGYSRHHPGYALDIACESNTEVVFAASTCFAWLQKNNYENAKKFGWIPSYPEGTTQQGPEPEAWEYVWVGLEALLE